jgi:hypothetical protein
VTQIVGVVHGISAALAVAGGFYLAGLIVTPHRWIVALGFLPFPVIGASLYVVVCVVAVRVWHVPVTGMMALFAISLAILSMLRFEETKAAIVRHLGTRACAAAVLVFAIFYTVVYVIGRAPEEELFLPPALSEHINLVTYARYARQLLKFGSPNLEAAAFDFSRAPGVAAILAGFSAFYRDDSLRAAVPLHFAVVALVGVGACNLFRALFRLSTMASLTVAGILLTSAYASDFARAYRLDTAMATVIVSYLMWASARLHEDAPMGALTLALASGYALLLLTDASALPVVIAIQAVLIGARMFGSRTASRIAVASAAAMGVALSAFHGQMQWSLAHFTPSAAFASTGIVVSIVAAGGLAYLALNVDWRTRLSTMDQRLVAALMVYIGIALILGNVVARASERRRTPIRIPAEWQNVERLAERSPRQVTMKLGRDPRGIFTAVTRYYLPTTKVEIIPPGVRIPDYGAASRENPLLIHNFSCEAAGHGDVMAIPEVGCALFAPPTVALDAIYPFDRVHLAVEFDNMSDPESGGRRSTGEPISLLLMADPERVRVDTPLYVNLLVKPLQPGDAHAERLMFTLATQKRAVSAVSDVSQSGWISIPISTADWARNRIWVLPISIEFPDGGAMLFQELSLNAIARGTVAQ